MLNVRRVVVVNPKQKQNAASGVRSDDGRKSAKWMHCVLTVRAGAKYLMARWSADVVLQCVRDEQLWQTALLLCSCCLVLFPSLFTFAGSHARLSIVSPH